MQAVKQELASVTRDKVTLDKKIGQLNSKLAKVKF